MSKNNKKTRKNIYQRNNTKSNGAVQKKNIFQLIQPINKIRELVNIKSQNPLVFAENMIVFLDTYHQEELNKLQFSENDCVNDLVVSLTQIILDLKYKIVYNDQNKEDQVLRILYDIKFGEWKWYIFDVITIDKIPCEELKIGYIHFLKALSPFCWHDATRSDYMNVDDTEYEMEFEMMGTEERSYNDEGKYDEGMAQEAEEEMNQELYRLRILKEKFDTYAIEPYERFVQYIPKNDMEKEFQSFLIKLIELDYSPIGKFFPSENIYDDGGIEFSDNILIYLDTEIEVGVESSHFSDMNDNANNGVSEPMGWYAIENGIVEQKTSEQDVQDLFHALDCFEKIYHNFLNKL